EADRAAAQGFVDAINAGVAARALARSAAYALAVAQQATITQMTGAQSLANYTQTVAVRFGDIYASSQTQAMAIAGINGQLAASYSIKVDANGNWAGLQIINGGGTTNAIKLRADLLTLTLPGYSEQPVMGIATVGGVPTLAFNGNIIADNTLLNAAIGSVDLNPATSATATGGSASVTVALKAGKPVQIIARSSAPAVNAVAAGVSMTTTLKQGATTLDSDTAYAASDNTGNGICGSANLMAVYTPPTDGDYTFTVANAVSTTKAIVVLRTYKG
ncbi:MAG: hypothetical protein KDA41_21380, partial [Planctomycetales bacterium]|nr:hypothetical protein [Planctomycetales bacterium]